MREIRGCVGARPRRPRASAPRSGTPLPSAAPASGRLADHRLHRPLQAKRAPVRRRPPSAARARAIRPPASAMKRYSAPGWPRPAACRAPPARRAVIAVQPHLHLRLDQLVQHLEHHRPARARQLAAAHRSAARASSGRPRSIRISGPDHRMQPDVRPVGDARASSYSSERLLGMAGGAQAADPPRRRHGGGPARCMCSGRQHGQAPVGVHARASPGVERAAAESVGSIEPPAHQLVVHEVQRVADRLHLRRCPAAADTDLVSASRQRPRCQ